METIKSHVRIFSKISRRAAIDCVTGLGCFAFYSKRFVFRNNRRSYGDVGNSESRRAKFQSSGLKGYCSYLRLRFDSKNVTIDTAVIRKISVFQNLVFFFIAFRRKAFGQVFLFFFLQILRFLRAFKSKKFLFGFFSKYFDRSED